MSIPSNSARQFAASSFDFLVVGGGTAGLVVAARLAENPLVKVGVLEAGPAAFDTPVVDVPGRYGEALATPLDWQFETEPQPGLAHRRLPWPRGKVLGGTSALNFMTWNRPNREDLDAWEALGNNGWGWDAMLPFYKKSEHFHKPSAKQVEHDKAYYDEQFLGTDGPLPIIYNNEYSVSHPHWHHTLNSLNIPTNNSHLSGSNVGAWTNVVTVDPANITRAYSATSYYLPNAGKENLKLLTNALAREIVLEQEDGKWTAKGVRFTVDNEEFTVAAAEEVIVAGGSVSSPQLLELSGIGNPTILKDAGIAVKVANPNVGENLQEHIMAASIFEVDPSIPSPDDLQTNAAAAAAADEEYSTKKSGPRTILACSMCYLPFSQFVPEDKLKELGARATGYISGDVASQRKAEIRAERLTKSARLGQIEYIFDIGNWSPFLEKETGKKYGTMLQILQYPFSVGSIHIPPRDPTVQDQSSYVKPRIDPRYYQGAGEIDLEVMGLCLEYGDKIASTAPLSGIITARASPAAGEKDLKKWLADNTITDWHPVGTCAMGGSEGIDGGVVDHRLRVYGVKGLRVVDASIMPLQISAHLQATVYAIAEKGAAMILEDGGY